MYSSSAAYSSSSVKNAPGRAKPGLHAASNDVTCWRNGSAAGAARREEARIKRLTRAEKLVGATARLEFYDWERWALTPSGKPVKDLLQTQDPTALAISRGSAAGSGPGSPGAGSMSLYAAVQLAFGATTAARLT